MRGILFGSTSDGCSGSAESASGTQLARYGHGALAGADDPLVSYAGSAITTANARFLYADPRGSIVLAASSSGAATATNAYDEYGIPGSANAGRFQYTGQAWLAELGLYYYKARMYSPTLGRFMQTDPIGYADNANLYAYVGNDPVNWVDPSGLASDLPKICPRAREQIQVCASPSDALARLAQAAAGMHPTIPSAAFLRHYRAPPKPQSGHDYRASKEICRRPLTNAEKRDIISRFTVPNANAGLPSGEGYHVVDYGGVPGGVVYTTYSADGLAGRNTTTPFHAFVGTIDQTIVNRGGASYLQTHGYGSAGNSWFGRSRDGINESTGPVVFDSLGGKAALYAAANYKGC